MESSELIENVKYRLSSTRHHSDLSAYRRRDANGTLPSKNKSHKTDVTMSSIEKFLATRDHVDKSEFDFVVRNLVELNHNNNKDGTYPMARNNIPLSTSNTERCPYLLNSTLSNDVPANNRFSRYRSRRVHSMMPTSSSMYLPSVSTSSTSAKVGTLHRLQFLEQQKKNGIQEKKKQDNLPSIQNDILLLKKVCGTIKFIRKSFGPVVSPTMKQC